MNFAGLKAVFKREFKSYFASPIGYIFIVIFLIASGFLTVSRDYGKFLELRHASLNSFFTYIPWIFVVMVPAVAMRLWAEERKSGTVELLFTLPISMEGSYLGKFLAGWCFLVFGLILTTPIAYWVGRLGDPDWGTIFTGYVGCVLLAGAYLSIGMLFSAATKNQVVAFILGVSACIVLLMLGLPQTLEAIGDLPFGGDPEQVFGGLSITDHFGSLTRGLLEFRSLVFFALITLGSLLMGSIVLNRTKAA